MHVLYRSKHKHTCTVQGFGDIEATEVSGDVRQSHHQWYIITTTMKLCIVQEAKCIVHGATCTCTCTCTIHPEIFEGHFTY